MTYRKTGLILAGILPSLLAACGGGSDAPAVVAGIDGTGARSPVAIVSNGTVTGFGSVIVNGVRFDTSNASFIIDGEPGTEDDLSVGDVVVVRGELDAQGAAAGTASTIVFDDLVEGPVMAIDVAAGTLTVLGQAVRINADTSFDDSIQPASLEGLAVDDIVEISGFVASDGSITATRIEPKSASDEFELTGVVEALDAASSRFSIRGQVVNYASAILNDFDDGEIDEGELVEVKAGTTLGAGGELLATRIEFKGGQVDGDDGDRVEIEGFVTRFVDITDFDVSGFPVTTDGTPEFEGGTAADLGLDVKVEVEGILENGVLVASEIDIRRSNALRLMANVDSVDAASGSFVVLGVTVRVDSRTRLEDKGPQDLDAFTLQDLLVDDYVEVRGAELPAGSGEVLASLLERDDDEPDVELRGFVEAGSVVEPSFSILGVSVTTGGSTVFRDADDSVISAATFFANAEGRLVDVDGLEIGDSAISASEVEFENE